MARRPDRAYLVRFAAAMVAYAVLLPLAMGLARGPLRDSPGRYAVVLLVLGPVAGIVWAVWRYAREADELQARILLESLAIALAAGSALTFTWGMLQAVGAPALGWTWVMPVYLACWLVATLVVRRRY